MKRQEHDQTTDDETFAGRLDILGAERNLDDSWSDTLTVMRTTIQVMMVMGPTPLMRSMDVMDGAWIATTSIPPAMPRMRKAAR